MNPALLAWVFFVGILLARHVDGQSQFFSGSSASASVSSGSSRSSTSFTQTSTSISSGSSSDSGTTTTTTTTDSEGGSKTVTAGTDAEGTEATSSSNVVAPPGESAVSISRSVVTDEGAVAGSVAASDDEAIATGVATPAHMDDDVLEDSEFAPAAEAADPAVDLPEQDTLQAPDELDLCQGLAKFQCCDDQDFVADGSSLFCGCWGSDVTQGCSFEVLEKTAPYVIKDLDSPGESHICRCREPKEVVEEECFGRTKISCCDEVEPGATSCRCLIGNSRCIYEKKENGAWHNTLFMDSDCVCPK